MSDGEKCESGETGYWVGLHNPWEYKVKELNAEIERLNSHIEFQNKEIDRLNWEVKSWRDAHSVATTNRDISIKDLQGAVELAFRAGFNYGTRSKLDETASWEEWKKRMEELKVGMGAGK